MAASAHQLNLSIPGHVGLGAVSINCATIARAVVIVQDAQRFIINSSGWVRMTWKPLQDPGTETTLNNVF